MADTISCAGCGAEVPIAARLCAACNTPVARSRRVRLGKQRLFLSVIVVLVIGYLINMFIDVDHGKPPPHPPQVLDAPQ